MISGKDIKMYITGAVLAVLALLAVVLAVTAVKKSQPSSGSSQHQSTRSLIRSSSSMRSDTQTVSRPASRTQPAPSPSPSVSPSPSPTPSPVPTPKPSLRPSPTPSPSPTPAPEITINDQVPFEEGDIMAVIFIGSLECVYDYSLADKYFAGTDLATISFEGQEKYLIIPKYPDDINIYSVSHEEDGLKDEYYTTARGAFYIVGNVPEVYRNMKIATVHNGKYYEFSPCLSGNDGSVMAPDFVTVIG